MTRFLCFVVLLLACAIGEGKLDESLITEEMKQLMETTHTTCVKETEVDEEYIKKVNEEGEFEDDDKLKCYTKCILKQTGMMDEDGAIDFTHFAMILPEQFKDAVKEMVDNCAHFTDEDLCEKAFNIVKCSHEHDPEHFFLI